jgi:alcohol dehydrogenase
MESLPREIAASCGLDAFSQLLESYLSTGASPMTDALAEEGLIEYLQSFRNILEGDAKQEDYSSIALGASLSGLTLANAGLGTVHGIAGIIGGLVDIPHGAACGLLVAPVMKETFKALIKEDRDHPALLKAAGLGQFLSGDLEMDTEKSIEVLLEELENWVSLAALPKLSTLGFKDEMIEPAARMSGNKNNPYSFTQMERSSLIKSVF